MVLSDAVDLVAVDLAALDWAATDPVSGELASPAMTSNAMASRASVVREKAEVEPEERVEGIRVTVEGRTDPRLIRFTNTRMIPSY